MFRLKKGLPEETEIEESFNYILFGENLVQNLQKMILDILILLEIYNTSSLEGTIDEQLFVTIQKCKELKEICEYKLFEIALLN